MASDERTPAADDARDQIRAIGRRVGTDPVEWERPPAELWDRIAAQAEVPGDPAPGVDTTPSVDVVPPTPSTARPAPSPRRRSPWRLAAAAAVIVVAVTAALAWALRPDPPAVVAQTPLERLGDTGEGHAELVERDDGRFELRVEATSLEVTADDFVEVWVINPDVTEMVSLGPLRRDGRYEIPAGLDPAGFPIVDISIEPIDGDPTHSGNSALRGQLDL